MKKIFLILVIVSFMFAKKIDILVLNSYHPTFTWTHNQIELMITKLKKKENISMYIEFMDTKRNRPTKKYLNMLLNLYKLKFKKIKFDIIIATDDNAINFIKKYKNEPMFEKAKVFFSGVNNLNVLKNVDKNDFTGVFERMTPIENYYLAKKIKPNFTKIYLIGDDSITFNILKKIYINDLNKIKANYEFISNKNLNVVLDKLKNVQNNSIAMIVMAASYNYNNNFISMKAALKLISEAYKNPIIATADVFVINSEKIIGGHCVDGVRQGRLVSDLVLKYLQTSKMPKPILKKANYYIFNHTALKYFRLNPDKLAKFYKLLYEPPSFYIEHKKEILLTLVFAIILSLITMLYSIKIKIANKKIAKNFDNIKKIIDAMNEGVILSKNNIIFEANNACAKLLGYESKNKLIGKSLYDLVSTKYKAKLKENLQKKELKPYEFTLKKSDGSELIVLATANTIKLDDEDIRISSFIDLTGAKEKEKILLNQSRLAAMGEMIGNIAHQWRQPLSIINTYASSILLYKDLGKLNDEYLNKAIHSIEKNIKYLSNTIDDFRDYIKGDQKVITFSSNELMDELYELVGPSLKNNNIQIIKNIQDLTIHSLKNQLLQVLINIINNAKDILRTKKDDDRFIQIDLCEQNEIISISVKDSGGGIPEKIIDKIFEPYFTTKDEKNGTGIGLYMSYNIVKHNLNGKIYAKNEILKVNQKEYKGAAFYIKIPKILKIEKN